VVSVSIYTLPLNEVCLEGVGFENFKLFSGSVVQWIVFQSDSEDAGSIPAGTTIKPKPVVCGLFRFRHFSFYFFCGEILRLGRSQTDVEY
jgi:hypothetical protein